MGFCAAGPLGFVVLAAIPPAWEVTVVARVFNSDSYDPDAINVIGPVILAGAQLVVLWFVWNARDPRSAGLALAALEGAAAVDLVIDDHPVLGVTTGIGALVQASSALEARPDTQERKLKPSSPPSDPVLAPEGALDNRSAVHVTARSAGDDEVIEEILEKIRPQLDEAAREIVEGLVTPPDQSSG